MYVFDPEVLNKIDTVPQCDIGYDLLPRPIGRAWTVLVDGYFRDIGAVETYWLALQEWPVCGAGQRLLASAAGPSAPCIREHALHPLLHALA